MRLCRTNRGKHPGAHDIDRHGHPRISADGIPPIDILECSRADWNAESRTGSSRWCIPVDRAPGVLERGENGRDCSLVFTELLLELLRSHGVTTVASVNEMDMLAVLNILNKTGH